MSRICLTLAGPDCASNLHTLKEYAGCWQAAELRLDLIPHDLASVADFLAAVADLPGAAETLGSGEAGDFSLILTLRRPEDGGNFPGTAAEGELILLKILETAGRREFWESLAPILAVDIEQQSPMRELEGRLDSLGVTRIRSAHYFDGLPEDPAEELSALSAGGAVPKLAAMPRGLAELAALINAGRSFAASRPGSRAIIVGMGEYGLPTRIMPEKLASHIGFAAAGGSVAPGQPDCRELHRAYRSRPVTPDTPVFAVVGNPVSHSRSPEYHNRRFADAGVDALYIPLLCDDPMQLPALSQLAGIRGLSVTIPHKETVRAILDEEDDASSVIGACNTVVRGSDGRWRGYNSDVPGFLAPLAGHIPEGTGSVGESGTGRPGATVIGAGGAARAAVYALLEGGYDILLLNRSAPRREEVAALFRSRYPGRVTAAPLDAGSAELVRRFRGIIVQTSPVGMTGKVGGDPLAFYPFCGDELVYDIIYTQPETPILRRAAAAGCAVINGWPMFLAQAQRQSELFFSVLES
jgi:3-dehydroquinate dehydratase/shikimate dehydrogenase